MGSTQIELTVGTGTEVLLVGVELLLVEAVHTPTAVLVVLVVAGTGAIGGYCFTQSSFEQDFPTQVEEQ